jgi:hypothetical protein
MAEGLSKKTGRNPYKTQSGYQDSLTSDTLKTCFQENQSEFLKSAAAQLSP